MFGDSTQSWGSEFPTDYFRGPGHHRTRLGLPLTFLSLQRWIHLISGRDSQKPDPVQLAQYPLGGAPDWKLSPKVPGPHDPLRTMSHETPFLSQWWWDRRRDWYILKGGCGATPAMLRIYFWYVWLQIPGHTMRKLISQRWSKGPEGSVPLERQPAGPRDADTPGHHCPPGRLM